MMSLNKWLLLIWGAKMEVVLAVATRCAAGPLFETSLKGADISETDFFTDGFDR